MVSLCVHTCRVCVCVCVCVCALQNKTRLYFVMDYLPGGELFFHLRRFVFARGGVRTLEARDRALLAPGNADSK